MAGNGLTSCGIHASEENRLLGSTSRFMSRLNIPMLDSESCASSTAAVVRERFDGGGVGLGSSGVGLGVGSGVMPGVACGVALTDALIAPAGRGPLTRAKAASSASSSSPDGVPVLVGDGDGIGVAIGDGVGDGLPPVMRANAASRGSGVSGMLLTRK